MWTIVKGLFAIGGGPAAWFASALSALASAFAWCLAHWKIVLSTLAIALVVGFVFHAGMKHEAANSQKKEAAWEKKWHARDVEDALVESEHQREVADLDAATAAIEAKAAADKAAREVEYQKIKTELKDYEKNHAGPVPDGDVCRAVDIGDDGLRLIRAAVAARLFRGNQAELVGHATVLGAAGADKPPS